MTLLLLVSLTMLGFAVVGGVADALFRDDAKADAWRRNHGGRR